jgi:Spy/CpxP family protein refolding chaperone
MMRNRPQLLGNLLGALLLAAAAPIAFAQPPGPRDGRGMHGPGGREEARALFEFLGLTDEQREAWADAHRSHFEVLKPTFEQIRDLREQIRTELDGDSPDAATLGGYLISIHDLEGELERSRADLEAAIGEILTTEQETKLEAWKAAHPERHHGPGGPHGGGRRPGGPGFGGPGGGGPEPDVSG